MEPSLRSRFNDLEFDAGGGAILPGLHDHHLHLFALAARRYSVNVGPPRVQDAEVFWNVLANTPGDGWIRGVGYHESVAGDLTAQEIDQWVPDRPVRIQHRSGRLWYLNSLAMSELGLGRLPDGQLYRQDEMLSERAPPNRDLLRNLKETSQELASFGVTHVTDATPTNDETSASTLKSTCTFQSVSVMGSEHLYTGHLKIILDDFRLPVIDNVIDSIHRVHELGRPVAIHCVSRIEVVFAIASIRAAGAMRGDRLEHATELSTDLIEQVVESGLKVVANPNFIYERGDAYIRDNPLSVLNTMYPLRTLMKQGAILAAGTDAPFGLPDPWVAMKAATNRKTQDNKTIAEREAIEPEEAFALFMPIRKSFDEIENQIKPGYQANFCILDRPWSQARTRLLKEDVQATITNGVLAYKRDNTTPTLD